MEKKYLDEWIEKEVKPTYSAVAKAFTEEQKQAYANLAKAFPGFGAQSLS